MIFDFSADFTSSGEGGKHALEGQILGNWKALDETIGRIFPDQTVKIRVSVPHPTMKELYRYIAI